MSISSKLAALSVTYPYQVVRSRIQVRDPFFTPLSVWLYKIRVHHYPFDRTPKILNLVPRILLSDINSC